MTNQPADGTSTDPTRLTLRVEHTAPLVDGSGLDLWQVQIQADGDPVGSLRAVRGLYGGARQDETDEWGETCSVMEGVPSIDLAAAAEQDWFPEQDEHLAELRSRLSAWGGSCAVVAEQLLSDEAVGLREFGSRSVLVFDQLSLSAPWNDPVTAACVISSVTGRAASGDFLLVFPAGTATRGADAALLEEAGRLLWAEQYSDDLYCLDLKFDHGEGLAEAWELLLARVPS
ncbi:hypothetical protein ACFWP3_18730 [Streptomyces sp. NPDC058525]|uniref:hypothetical protein n=1 Tax=Streptomyces sp. NPDC058525 TaxID=3346538 RepID=UPI00365BAE05